MVFQSYALYPHKSVKQNLEFGLKLRRTSEEEIERRVALASEILGISELLGRKPKQLSGGQRQRVALGRAIVREPEVFLMDEPLSNLDAKLRTQTRAELIGLQKRLGTTTIYVTHDQVEAMTMGHRIAIMDSGIVQQLDTPQNIYDAPRNLFVAGFVGSPPMNFVTAEVGAGDGGLTLASAAGDIRFSGIRHDGLASYIGDSVIVGVRPEAVEIVTGAERKDGVARAAVELVEPLGPEKLLHLRTSGGTKLLTHIDSGRMLTAGDEVDIVVKPERLYFFDRQTELALGRQTAESGRRV
jgi:multiple sugar transport system ATP-binding protein